MKKPYIFGAVAAVALIAVAYFFVLPMFKGGTTKTSANSAANSAAPPTPFPYRARGEETVPGLMYPISERVLNLASTGSTPHYARLQMTIEFARPAGSKPAAAPKAATGSATPLDPLLDPVEAHSAQIDDILVRLLGGMSLESITSSSGQDQFKQKLLDQVAQVVPGLNPINAYFQELVVQ